MKKGEIKMDYKEEYQKALERAKKGLPIDEVFPELKESEDERIRKELVEYFSHTGCNFIRGIPIGRVMDYLEKQKEQKPIEWREEDEYKVDVICKLIEHATIIPRSGDDDTGIPPTRLNDKYKGELKAFIKALRPQPKQEWSEEDENKKGRLISIVKRALHGNKYPLLNDNGATELITWLKSIRPNHWKPSEEQIEALEWMLTTVSFKDGGYGVVLKNLINDLKKQM